MKITVFTMLVFLHLTLITQAANIQLGKTFGTTDIANSLKVYYDGDFPASDPPKRYALCHWGIEFEKSGKYLVATLRPNPLWNDVDRDSCTEQKKYSFKYNLYPIDEGEAYVYEEKNGYWVGKRGQSWNYAFPFQILFTDSGGFIASFMSLYSPGPIHVSHKLSVTYK